MHHVACIALSDETRTNNVTAFFFHVRHIQCRIQKLYQVYLSGISCVSLIHYYAVIFLDEDDVATYTIKSIDDPRTLNKTIYLRPQENILTQNEVIAKWEKLSGKTLQKFHITADVFLASMKGMYRSFMFFNMLPNEVLVLYKHAIYCLFAYICRYGLCFSGRCGALLPHFL
jgi:hypothetical protein